jgi:hypothetical protein
MKPYKFANLPSNASVDFTVTGLVSVWFLVAAGAILGDPPSPYGRGYQGPAALQAKATTPAATKVAIAPEARLTITVQARRSAAL